jgi:DNA-binding transcriptional ArsR family regulator
MSTELESLFSSAARVDVLQLFLLNPDHQYYQREIERETGQPIRAVQREVKRLSEIELLTRREEGNRVYYQLNPSFPLLAELSALFQKMATGEQAVAAGDAPPALPPEPFSIEQPFAWMESPPIPALPSALAPRQTSGEWDRSY